jgi:2-polyprenyl-3-methyl-5-hydroxy-6-metoxy-1,4-benzoquinol methylase
MTFKKAIKLHENVPADWYYSSIRKNIIQKYVHTRRFNEVSKLIEPTGGKILDIGSADGVFTNVISKESKAEKIIGIDVLKKSVDWANIHWKDSKMKFYLGDAENLKYEKETFDAIFALEVLEHVQKPIKVLENIKRLLKINGYAIFLVPAETFLFQFIWFIWVRTRGKVWNDTHINIFKNNGLTKLCKSVGFKIAEDKKIIFGTLHLIKVRKQ